jgi:flagellum-specific ATP synthase
VLSRELAQRGQYPAIDVGASLSRVMSDVATPEQSAVARRFRALVSGYESNRDLVLMGAYRAGADAIIDRGIALQPQISAFLSQACGEHVSLPAAMEQLGQLIGDGQ